MIYQVSDDLKEYIQTIPKVELHIHLEGMINKELIKKMNNNIIPLNYDTFEPFDKFNTSVDILCQNFKNNIKILLEYVFKDRFRQNIFYTQFQYSALKINEITKLTIKKQFDIIIPIIQKLRKQNIYKNIYIDFILDIPRGNADTYSYFTNFSYANEIIDLIKLEKNKHINILNYNSILPNCEYKYYLRGMGIGGRAEDKTINNYSKYFDKIKENNILIVPHAGEFGNTNIICNSINNALDYNMRLGHGVRILECNDSYINIKNKKDIVLDISITSNLNFIKDTKYTLQTHPIKDLIKKGYYITLSTDDPGILYQHYNGNSLKNIDLIYEYTILASLYHPNEQKQIIKQIVLNGINNIPIYYDTTKNKKIPYLEKIQLEKIKEINS